MTKHPVLADRAEVCRNRAAGASDAYEKQVLIDTAFWTSLAANTSTEDLPALRDTLLSAGLQVGARMARHKTAEIIDGYLQSA